MNKSLYDDDYLRWTEETARALRERRFDDVDIENAAEEIESLGRSQREALESRLIALLGHLLKWEHQPGKRKYGWQATIREQRLRIARLLREMPSLAADLDTAVIDAYEVARIRAAGETDIDERDFPAVCPFTREQILNEGFLPE